MVDGATTEGMDSDPDGHLRRTSSHNSVASSKSRRSTRNRVRSAQTRSAAVPASPAEVDKGLTSFPSLAPDTPPKDPRVKAPNNLLIPRPDQEALTHAASTVAGLTVVTPSARQRTALFNDSPLAEHLVPGTLHHTTDEHIERLAARNGAVALIRQLAEDLAQRDAQMSALQRRAEEREKVLRRMLLECEVSNMDIEARMHRAMAGDDPSSGRKVSGASTKTEKEDEDMSTTGGTIDDMVNLAMSESLGDETSSPGLDSPPTARSSRQPSIRTGSMNVVPLDEARTSKPAAVSGGGTQRGASRSWVDYLWTGNGTSRRTSGTNSLAGEGQADDVATAKPRKAAGQTSRRKVLSSELFQAPDASAGDRQALPEAPPSKVPGLRRRQSSTSVASWAVKLVAGSSRTTLEEESIPEDSPSSVRGPSSDQRRVSATSSSTKPLESARSALSKISGTRKGGQTTTAATTALRTPSLTVGPNGTIKAVGSPKRAVNTASPATSVALNSPITSGPVEMDAILPPDTQPPTLHQTYNHHHPTDYITDRFGFIYDRRRRLRKKDEADENQAQHDRSTRTEMLSSATDSSNIAREEVEQAVKPVGEQPSPVSGSRPVTPGSNQGEGKTSRWQDYLKIATFPTELLSHTPGGGRMPTVEPAESAASTGRAHVTVAEGGGTLLPASLNAQPSASTVVTEHAMSAKPLVADSSSTSNADQQRPEPVRLLVEQLTELHDSLQRDRTVKWNEFLRKVRAERRREGEAAAVMTSADGRPDPMHTPEVALADGEVIGVAGLGNKGKIGRAKWKEFKRLVLSGIPVAYRAKVWSECSGATAMRTPGYYGDLVKNGVDDAVIVTQIAMDVNRTLTDNVFFREGPGVVKLNEVLLAYSRRNPEIGYCQGMNLLAASLLLIVPTAEDAFWLLASMIENMLPPNYYDHSLLASRADQQVLRQYVSQLLPGLSAHLEDLGIELEALTFQWFLSVFTGCLSAEALYRVWDVVLCTNDGSTFLFQVALALLSLNEKALLRCDSPAGVYSYINHHMTNHAISIDGLIHASDALRKVVTRPEIEEKRAKVIDTELRGRRPLTTRNLSANDTSTRG